MKRFNFLLTGILVVLLASCSQRTQITDSKPTVKIDTVLSAGGQTALQFPGRVKAAQDISLSFRVSGTILRMYVNDGTYVRKGQLLAELDPADYQIQLDAAEAEYQSVKAEAERVMALYKENVTTPDANDKAMYGLKQITASTIMRKISWNIPVCMLLSADMYRNVFLIPMRLLRPVCPLSPLSARGHRRWKLIFRQ